MAPVPNGWNKYPAGEKYERVSRLVERTASKWNIGTSESFESTTLLINIPLNPGLWLNSLELRGNVLFIVGL